MKRPFSKKAMLTLQKDARGTELVEIHKRSTRSKKAFAKVYYSHSARGKTSNVAPAAGVLALHKNGLKKVHKLSNADFERICVMIDTNEEPDVGEALRSEYWELHKVYERALRTEMYLGDQSSTSSTTCPATSGPDPGGELRGHAGDQARSST